MSKILKIVSRPYMKRPVIYKTVTKVSVILVLSLLWERFFNKGNQPPGIGRAFAILGTVCLCLAWFSYLALDGFEIHYLNKKAGKQKKNKHKMKDIVDFIDEKVISFDELEKEEQIVCGLLSSIIAGLLFVFISSVFYI